MGGFTLLEVMVALAIFATLAMAVLSASQYVVRLAGTAEERMLAAWVADNQLNELRLQPGVAIGRSQRVVQMAQREWVIRQHVRSANDLRMLAVDVEVTLAGRDQDVHRASGWLPNRHE